MFMDSGEEIRFRVVAETFTDTTPSGPNNDTNETALDSKENKRSPYLITVSSYYIIFFYYYYFHAFLLFVHNMLILNFCVIFRPL